MAHSLPQTTRVLQEGIERGQHLGAQVYVSRQGKRVAEVVLGQSRLGVGMAADTLTLWMSMGKPVTAALIAKLADAGRLDVQQPVADFLPEFGQSGKEQVSIAHLLTHSGGFRHVGSNWSNEPWGAIIGRISAAALEEEWILGETAGYHTSSSWFVLSEVARRLYGDEDPRAMYRREIFEPLGMPDCWIGMPRHKWIDYGTRVAYMYDSATGRREAEPRARSPGATQEPGGSRETEASNGSGTGLPSADTQHGWHGKPLGFANSEAGSVLCRPGGNARGPMSELGRFYEQLLIDRRDMPPIDPGRPRLLSEDAARLFTSRRLPDVYDKTFGTRLDWGYGFIINAPGRRFPYNYGPHASADAFGHSGNQSTCAFADPAHGLVVCWATNGMPGELPHQRRQTAVNAAVYEDLGLA